MREEEYKDTTENWNRRYENKEYSHLDTPGAAILYKTIALFANECYARTILDVGCGHGNLIKYLDNSRIEMITTYVDIHKPRHLVISTLVPWHDFDLDRDILDKELFPKRYKLVHDKTLMLQIEQYSKRRILLLEVLS